MTLSSETVKVQYSGNGSTTVFPVTFAFWDADDLRVISTVTATGVETVWTRGTQYTITGGSGSTGTLTVSTSPTDYTPASGTTLTIKSNLDDTQDTDIPLGGALDSAAVEQQLDKIVRQVQQKEERLSRAILLTESSTAMDITVADPEAGTVLRWNDDEDGLENATITGSGSITIPVPIAQGGTAAITAGAARTALAVPGLADNNTLTGTLTMSGKSLYQAEGATVASATTPSASPIWAGDGDTIHLSGTTTITGFAAAPQAGAWKRLILDGAISFTHSANLNCQGAVDFVGAAGDHVLVYADTTTQFDLFFFKASGAAVVAPAAAILTKSFVSSDQAITAAGLLTLAHGLSGITVNTNFRVTLLGVCQSTDAGWAANDVTVFSGTGADGVVGATNRGAAIYWDATNVYVRFGSEAGSSFLVNNKGSGAIAGIDNTKWKVRVVADI